MSRLRRLGYRSNGQGDVDVIQFGVTPACLHSTVPLTRIFIWDSQIATPIPGRETGCAPLCEFVKTGKSWNEELNSHVESEGFPARLHPDPRIGGTSLLGGPEAGHYALGRNSANFRKVSTRYKVWYYRSGDAFLAP